MRITSSFHARTKLRPKRDLFTVSKLLPSQSPSYNSAQSFCKKEKTQSWMHDIIFLKVWFLYGSHWPVPAILDHKVFIHHDCVNVAGSGWSSGGQPSHGWADHIFSVKNLSLYSPPPPRQPLALGTYATNKCSYNLFIIKIVSPLPSTPPQGGYIMQKSLHQQCQVTVRTPVSVKTSKPFMCLFS